MSSRFERVITRGPVEKTLPSTYGLDLHSDFSRAIGLCSLVLDAAKKKGYRSFLVGGAVRDLLLGDVATPNDLDFTVEGSSLEVANLVQRILGGNVTHHTRFLTAKVDAPDIGVTLDFASTRMETYPKPGALPNVSPALLEQDLGRRDFSINALAVSLETFIQIYSDDMEGRAAELRRNVIDVTGGLEDLAQRKVRVLHAESFLEDPTRLFRACRYASRIGGELEGLTKVLFREALELGAPESLSNTRVVNELRKMWGEREGLEILRLAGELHLLTAACQIPLEHLEELITILAKLRSIVQKVGEGSCFIAALRVLERYQERGGVDLLAGATLKRKVIARIRHETPDRILDSDPRELEDDSLLFWGAVLEDDEALVNEIRRRLSHPGDLSTM